jgi:hypothetical protein
MQCNPNNERYWSSRGYCDDDDEESRVESSYSYSAYLSKLRDKLDFACIDLFGKKSIFRNHDVNDYDHAAIPNKKMLFNEVLEEDYFERVVLLESKKAAALLDKFTEDIHIVNAKDKFKMFRYKFVEFKLYFSKNYLIVEYDKQNQGGWYNMPTSLTREWFFGGSMKEDNIVNGIEEVLSV